MDINFFDPADLPVPRSEVRFSEVTAAPYPDGRRVRLNVHLTPFQERPNVDIAVFNRLGQEVASMTIIESMDHRFDLTVHLRGPRPEGQYTARCAVGYAEEPPVDTAETLFNITPPV